METLDLRVRQPDHVQSTNAHLRLHGRGDSLQTREPVPVPERGDPSAQRALLDRRRRDERLLLLLESHHVGRRASARPRGLEPNGPAGRRESPGRRVRPDCAPAALERARRRR